MRPLLAVSLASVLVSAGLACGHDGVGPDRSITGSYTLTRVYDVPMPSLVKEPPAPIRCD